MRRPLFWLVVVALALGTGLVWQHACQGPKRPVLTDASRPHVILIVIDTLRGDMLAGPAGEAAEMPFAHELARRGVLFTDVTAPAPWTVPSLASLLSGLWARDTGTTRMVATPRLPAGVPTWAQAFGRAGYATAAYVGGPWALQGPDGLLRGYDAAASSFGLDQAPRRLDGWRRSLRPGTPNFLLLHTFEAHEPYGEENNRFREQPLRPTPGLDVRTRREPWEWARTFFLSRADRIALGDAHGDRYTQTVVKYIWSGYRDEPRPELAAELRKAYVDGVRWVDGLLRTLVGWLEREGLLENTMLVVTSDHGEAFGEHGTLEHGRILHKEVLHVPLLVVGPGPWQGGRVVREPVSLMDLMPTLAEAAGVTPPPGTVGRSLLPLVTGLKDPPRVALSYERVGYDTTRDDLDLELRSARTARHAAILSWDTRRGTLHERLFDRVADPGEHVDLAGGRGTLEGLPLGPELCEALEALRAELVADGMPEALVRPCTR
jgi:arylsulfatase A-like enzyme